MGLCFGSQVKVMTVAGGKVNSGGDEQLRQVVKWPWTTTT
jgi:hypothetical protein